MIAPVKRLASVLNGATPKSGIEEFWNGDIHWFTPTDLDNTKVTELAESARRITKAGLCSCAAQLAPPNSVVISSRAPVGSVGVTAVAAATNQGCRTLVPINGFPSKLLANALVAAREQLQLASNGTTFLELSTQALADFKIPVPPADEWSRILSYIDHATTRIDALVAKKTRFIELLREKRQAVITHAVTKGLDAGVPIKDSGVEWLGEVPAHWELVPSHRVFSESTERAHPNDQLLSATQKYGVIPKADFEEMEGRRVTHVEMHLDRRKHVNVDNFVISMRSFEGGIEHAKATGCVRSSYVVLVATPKVHIGYFSYLLKSRGYIFGLQRTSTFIRDGQDLNFNNFRQVSLPVFGIEEQQSISEYLDRTTTRIDTLIAKTERSIELLREHRTALITAAVTGKIDLRDAAYKDSP
jgi:type I restriction enzyme S subunit